MTNLLYKGWIRKGLVITTSVAWRLCSRSVNIGSALSVLKKKFEMLHSQDYRVDESPFSPLSL